MLVLEKASLAVKNNIDQSRSFGCSDFKGLTRFRQSLLLQEDERRLTACKAHVQQLCKQIQAFLLKGRTERTSR